MSESLRRAIILGFGSVASTSFKMMAENLPISEFYIYDKVDLTESNKKLLSGHKYTYTKFHLKYETLYEQVLAIVKDGDIVFDFLGCNDTITLIKAVQSHKDVCYLNCSLEEDLDHEYPSECALYSALDELKPLVKGTSCIDSGANPGLITHFSKLATIHMAESAIKRNVPDSQILKDLVKQKDYAGLATQLQIEQIHVSELEEMTPSNVSKLQNKAVNSWCPPAFLNEWVARSEVAIGSNEKEYFTQPGFDLIADFFPPTALCPYPLYLYSSTPEKVFIGKCVRHPETKEISKIFYDKKTNHCPAVSFIYHPSRISIESIKQENFINLQPVCFTEDNSGPLEGKENMGALLISKRDDIPMRWCGSILTCEETRRLECRSNPTVLQVAACVIAHMKLAIKNPYLGIQMPGDFDPEEVIEIAKPYLGIYFDGDLPHRLPAYFKDCVNENKDSPFNAMYV